MIGRGSETPETLALRLKDAQYELDLAERYDEVIVNDDLDAATQDLVAAIEKHERS